RAALPGAAAGAVYEGIKAAAEGEPLPEIGKEAAVGAALFGGGDVAARALGKAALTAWQRLRTTPKPGVQITPPLTAPERPFLAPPAAPGEGRVFRPVSWRPGPTAKPVPVGREIPKAPAEVPGPAELPPLIEIPRPPEYQPEPPAVPKTIPTPKDKFSAPGGLNGKALYLDGKIIYPSEIAAKADEVAGNFNVTAAYLGQDAGHDALYLARAAKSGDKNAIDEIFGTPGVHITKEGNSFTLRFDPDGFMREMHGYSDIDVFNKLFDATQALYKEGYKNNKLFIPELRYKGTIEEFLGKLPEPPGLAKTKGAPPEISRILQRGKKGAVRVVFPDEGHALLFDLASTVKKAAEGKISDLGPYVDRVRHLLKLPEDANVGALAADYRNRVIGQASSLEKGVVFRAPGWEEKAISQKPKTGVQIPIEERTFEEVGSRKVKAYMYEHPELKPFIQAEAERLLAELRDSVKGERFHTYTSEGEHIITGTRRFTSEPIARIKDATGASYEEIEKALQRIIKDEGQENQALAKKIELVIDDNLTRGTKTLEGYELPPNEDYIRARGGEIRPVSEEEKIDWDAIDFMRRPGAPAQPAGQTGATSPAARRVIIKRLQKVLDIPIRVGRYQQTAPGAIGIFKRRQEVIRTKLAEDLPVIAHEVGHYLDKLFGIRNQIPVGNMRAELVRLGQTQPANHFREGIAEFVRHYLSGEDTARLAPEFHVWFENTVRQQPEIWDALQQFRQDFIDYATAPAAARVKAAISVGEGQKRKVTLDRIMGAAVDELRPIDTFVEKATGGKRGNLSAAEDPFVQAWLFRGWTGKARAAIHHGVYDKQGNKVAPALVEILRPVAKNIDDFRAYIVAKRAVELHGRGINPGIELNDARTTVAQFDTPEFRTAHEQLKNFQDAILDRLVESGVLSAEQKATMRQLNQEYVPFYRVFEEQAGGVGFGKRGFGDLAQPVKRIKGSGRTIVDPLESIIKNTYYLTNIAERNNVGRVLVDFADKFEGMGKFIEKVDPKKYPITFRLNEISDLLDQVGAQVPEDALKKIATIFRPQMMGAPKENILAVFRDGKRELYQLDPELYRATLMLDREAANTLVRLLSYPTSWLRAGATLTPEFMVRNVARDAMSAWIYSKYGFIPVVDTIRGLFHVIRRDDLYQKWLSSGGASANFVSLDRDYLQGDLRKLMTTTIWGRMKQFAAHPLEVLRAISEFSEEATRLGEFGKGLRAELKKGATMEEALQRAALASRDITLDFSRMGTVGKPANQLIAFFNASVQGLDKMRRAFTKGGARGIANSTFKALVGITLPSVYLWWLNHDDPRYQELPQWRKDLFWNILTPNHVISIPKPFELGIIFGTLPERVLDWLWDHDQEAMRQFKHTLTEVTFPNWIPTALLPAIEVASNYSFFKGQPLTPMGEQYLLKQEQYGPYTTEAAKRISQALAGGGEAPLSPREIENLVRGYAGGLGMYGLQAISAAMPKEAPAPARDVTGLPGLKGVSAEYYQGSASIDRFYQRLEELEKKARTVKKYNDAGKPAPAKLWFDPAELQYLRQTQRQLADLRKIREQVIKDKTMTPERKKAALDRINIEMINRARAALRMEPIPVQSHQR
ncbi:MAG: LPD38 domain-containing protein, partial [Desulfotomaculales bacterium]